MRILIILFIILFSVSAISAQTLLQGSVRDKVANEPVEYATVSLLKDGKVIDGTSTDSAGLFHISNVPGGRYKIKAEFLGYLTDTSTIVTITDKQTTDIPVIYLSTGKQVLSEVTIASTAPVVENKIDKIVYNAANDVTAQGGVALDVLKKVPQVTVDADGNVELQGNPNVRFLINGKPSSIFGNS